MRLRDRAAWILFAAVFFLAVKYAIKSEFCRTVFGWGLQSISIVKAEVALKAMPVSVPILNAESRCDSSRSSDVFNVVAIDNISRTAMHLVGFSGGQYAVLSDPRVHLYFVDGIWSDFHIATDPSDNSWRLPIVLIRCRNGGLFIGFGWWNPQRKVALSDSQRGRLPEIRSSAFLKLIPAGLEGVSGEAGLLDHDNRIKGDQYSRYFRPSKLTLLAGILVVVSGLILLFKVIDKINLDPRFNENMAIGGFFFALALFCIGGVTVLWSVGLV